MKYQFLLFDLDNTLLDFNLAEDKALNTLFTKYGVKNEEIELYKAFYKPLNQELWKKLEQKLITREELLRTRFYKLFSHFGIELDGEVLAKEYEFILGEHGDHIDGAIELLEELQDSGFQIIAISNGVSKIQRSRLFLSEVTSFLKEIFISEEMGVQKPDIEFFQMVESKVNLFDKEKSIVIGDSLSADIQGANNYEIDCVWYNPDKKENTGTARPTFEVGNFEELKKLLLGR